MKMYEYTSTDFSSENRSNMCLAEVMEYVGLLPEELDQISELAVLERFGVAGKSTEMNIRIS